MNIILFTGLSASGKTTVSREVARQLLLPRVDVHEIIHNVATQQNYPRARDWIFAIGLQNALEESRKQLTTTIEEVRERNERGVVVDEVLDPETLQCLRSRFHEDEFHIVHINTTHTERVRFMLSRLGLQDVLDAEQEIRFIDDLKECAGIRHIIDEADYRFSNHTTVAEVSKEIVVSLNRDIFREGREASIRKEREI